MASARLSQICALSRSVNMRAAAAGQMNIAITRIEPTASNAATATAPTSTISPRLTAPAGMPIVEASSGSNEVILSSL